MDCFTHTFPNGLRLIHLPADSPVGYCGFGINAGTRDEEENEAGLAHFVEHLLFKGTAKRSARHILNRMETVGGELNAYTTKEDTFVYSIFMEEHFPRAFELLADIVFDSRFPSKEIDKERDVVIDEINTYRDNPSELIFDEFENMIFNGHSLGHNILGDEDSLGKFTGETVSAFFRKFYVPSNMVFFSMGRMKPEKIVRRAEAIGSDSPRIVERRRTVPPAIAPQHKVIRQDTHQAHIIMGGKSYGMYEGDDKRTPLFMLNNLLGGPGMNSRLNIALREKHGMAYNVESSLSAYTDTGIACIYFGVDPRHREKAVRLVNKELDRVCSDKLTASQLFAVRKQTTGQMAVACDNKENTFLSLGKQFLHHNRYETVAELFKKIERVTAAEILEAANEVFLPTTLSSLVYE
jgi:predicted Zn-dependent peptidase